MQAETVSAVVAAEWNECIKRALQSNVSESNEAIKKLFSG